MIPYRKLHRVLSLRSLPSVLSFVFMFTLLYCLPQEARVAHQNVYKNFTQTTQQILVPDDVPRTRSKLDTSSDDGLSWLVTPQDFFTRLERPNGRIACRRLRAIGGTSCRRIMDGHKQMCMDKDVYLNPRNCTVYSFGVADEVTFDTAINRYGCEVFLLDPTLPPDAYNDLGPKMKFFPFGIYSDNTFVPMNLTHYEDWQGSINVTLLTYEKVQQKLGHHLPPDYLKLDIEGAEWHVLPHMMDRHQLTGIKQLAVEIHVDASMFNRPEVTDYLRRLWKILERLREHGFQQVHYEPTRSLESHYIVPGTNISFNTCGELFLIRRS